MPPSTKSVAPDDVIRLIRRQPHRGARDVFGFADPLVGNQRHQVCRAPPGVFQAEVLMGVLIAPGAMVLTRIRWGASSWAMLSISISIPPLEAA